MSINVSSDFIGRIANISLAPSPANALVPLFEAVMNSIQAIEDRFGSDNLTRGNIEIEIFRDDEEGLVQSFEVRDNGIGFDAENLKSFAKSDSRHKEKRGGKGIGRFMWLKVFDAVRIDSRYGPNPSDTLGFDFLFSDHDQIRNEGVTSSVPSQGTVVKLASMKSEYRSVCPKKTETLQAKLIGHFLSYFVNLNTPKMVLIDGDRFDLFEVFADYVREDHERDFAAHLSTKQRRFPHSPKLTKALGQIPSSLEMNPASAQMAVLCAGGGHGKETRSKAEQPRVAGLAVSHRGFRAPALRAACLA